jgi:peptidoglycan/xylan/chitin deacetylase (PgdA/CDA1 family)
MAGMQSLISRARRILHERVPATLFINARWIKANPRNFRQLAADPLFEIGNHGIEHRALSVIGRSAYGDVLGDASANLLGR